MVHNPDQSYYDQFRRRQRRTRSLPPGVVTYTLIAINVVLYGVSVIQTGSIFDNARSGIFPEMSLINPAVAAGQYWRIVTSGFVHFGLIHIGLNMYCLYVFGRDLEVALGRWRYLALYAIALLGGSAAVLAFSPGAAMTGGASGAIYGLMGAILIVLIRAKANLTQILVIIVANVVLSMSIAHISIAAHIGGLVFGVAATAMMLYLPVINRTKTNLLSWVGLATVAVIALVCCVSGVWYQTTLWCHAYPLTTALYGPTRC